MSIQIQFRRGTASQWTAANTVLAEGEMAIETDTHQFKIGDGATAWNSLAYGGLQGTPGLTEGEAIMIRDTFTAGGDIAPGDAVYVDSNGKIRKGIVGSATGSTKNGVLDSTQMKSRVCWLDDTHFILAYAYSTYVKFKVGVVSGTTVTYGDVVSVAGYSSSGYILSVKKLSTTSFVALYVDSSPYVASVVGTVSGNAITLGSPDYNSHNWGSYPTMNNEHFLEVLDSTHYIICVAGGASTLRMHCCSVSGTTITKGTASDVTIYTASLLSGGFCVLDSSHFVVIYSGSAANISVMCCSVTGTTITQGTPATITTSYSYISHCSSGVRMLSATSFIAFFSNSSNAPRYTICTVSGTTITIGSSVMDSVGLSCAGDATSYEFRLIVNSSTLCTLYSTYDRKFQTITISGTVPTIAATSSAMTGSLMIAAGLASNTIMMASEYYQGSPYTLKIHSVLSAAGGVTIGGEAVIFTHNSNPSIYAPSWCISMNPSGNLGIVAATTNSVPNYTNFTHCFSISTTGGTTAAGIALESASLDESCDVALQAASLDVFTALTPGAVYYITSAGGLSTVAQTINGTSSRLGTAATTSKILVNTAKTDPKQLY